MSVGVDAANLGELRHIALGDQIEMAEHRLHRRIEAVFVFQLQRQAFGQIARADADRIEALQHFEHGFDRLAFAAKPRRDFVQIGAQIARLVDRIDQRHADQPLLAVQGRDGELVGQMILERAAVGDSGFQKIFVAFEALAGLDGRPIGERRVRRGRRRSRLRLRVEIVARRVQIFAFAENRRAPAPPRAVRPAFPFWTGFAFRFGRAVFVAFQQRIVFQLLLAIFRQVRHSTIAAA